MTSKRLARISPRGTKKGLEAAPLLNVYLDYLFLVIYSTTIGPACLWGAGTLRA